MKIARKITFYALTLMLVVACGTKVEMNKEEAPLQSKVPIVYKKAEPVSLSPSSVPEFIQWASGSEVSERETVRKEIVKSSKNEAVLDLLIKEFKKVELKDLSYSLTVLSIIGEMKNPNSFPFYEEVLSRKIPDSAENFHSGLTRKDLTEILASKVVECAAYLKTDKSDQLVLDVAAQHPSAAVRRRLVFSVARNKRLP